MDRRAEVDRLTAEKREASSYMYEDIYEAVT